MARRVLLLKRADHTLQIAAAALLDRSDLSPASWRSYAQTLQRLGHAIGNNLLLGTLDGSQVETAVQQPWDNGVRVLP